MGFPTVWVKLPLLKKKFLILFQNWTLGAFWVHLHWNFQMKIEEFWHFHHENGLILVNKYVQKWSPYCSTLVDFVPPGHNIPRTEFTPTPPCGLCVSDLMNREVTEHCLLKNLIDFLQICNVASFSGHPQLFMYIDTFDHLAHQCPVNNWILMVWYQLISSKGFSK